MKPHSCPVCGGTGRIIQTEIQGAPLFRPCVACHGTGVVWEQEFVPEIWPPAAPILPAPIFVPDDPVVPLTFTKESENIQKKSKTELVKMLKDWIDELEPPNKRKLLNETKKTYKKSKSRKI